MRILLIVYDNASVLHSFPIGLGYIAAILKKNGYNVEIYSQDKEHYPEDHLTQYLNENKFDVVGVSFIAGYYQYRKMLSISKAINASVNRPFYMVGGHGPTPDPIFFLKKLQADAAVMGEGEETVIELLNCLSEKKSLTQVKGIAFREDNTVIINERRHLIKDIDSIPFPAYELFPMDYYRLKIPHYVGANTFSFQIISGRGCKFKCTFCYRMDQGFRPRCNESIIEEIKLLKKNYRITDIGFSDELLMSSAERTISLCEDFIKADLNITWACNGRLNYARPEVLNVMKKAGCKFINYGIESMDNQVLKNMKKGLTVDQVLKGIENTMEAEITPNLNIIFGNIGDNRETLEKGVELLLKYEDGNTFRTIRPVTPYPGCPLFYHAIEKGLIKDCEDFYENKHVNSDLLSVNFTDLTDDEFYQCLLEANTKLIKNSYSKRMQVALEQTQALYLERDASFRGFRVNN